MQKLYAAVCNEEVTVLPAARNVSVLRFFIKDRGSALEAIVEDNRIKTQGTYKVSFDGENLTCSCGQKRCAHIYKVLLKAEEYIYLKPKFIDPEPEYLYVRERNRIRRINIKELGLDLKNAERPYKDSYQKYRMALPWEAVGVEYETYGPRRGYFEEYNALINKFIDLHWKYEYDASLPGYGGELKSPPIKTEHEFIRKLAKKLDAIRLVSQHGERSGFHVHVSFPETVHIDKLVEFFNSTKDYISKIERYFKLQKLFGRSFNNYARKIADSCALDRYCWINFTNLTSEVPTLEVRLGSTRAKNYEALIYASMAIKDMVLGYWNDFKNNYFLQDNPFMYIRKGLFKYIDDYVVPEAKLLLWQAWLRKED